ncbi:hypothetical protein BDZ89DRAFT_1255821 [Hymenopellis radicata]|nr:hypothetical protein BDZ89DRAFT_1255821 [Hymenopellis radicata]
MHPPPTRTSTSPSSASSFTPPTRTRKRSMSLGSTTTPPRRSASMSVEWLGPRTTKAFRAAGLLDESESAHHPRRQASVDDRRYTARFGSVKGGREGERPSWSTDVRTTERLRDAPYTARFSSVRSYRSPSRMSSESPRSASTAPSSFSWGDRDTFAVKDDEDTTRHAMEMSALLGALSDSQRSARMLREQNAELRERLGRREEELLGMIGQLEDARRYRRGEDERVGEVEEENAVLRSVVDDLRREIGDMLGSVRKQVSSVFPAPPANMTMLVGEDSWLKDARPPSAGPSILTMGASDSQVSLALKPEHAMHLGDMDAMSLYDGSVDR